MKNPFRKSAKPFDNDPTKIVETSAEKLDARTKAVVAEHDAYAGHVQNVRAASTYAGTQHASEYHRDHLITEITTTYAARLSKVSKV